MKLSQLVLKITSLLILTMTNACSQPKTFEDQLEKLYKNTVPLMKAEQLQKSKEDNVFLLDTREAEEFAVSHLPGATWVGFEDFKMNRLEGIPKNAKVVLYCSVGYRSERIGEKLQGAGFTDVYNLYGGIFGWYNQKNPVVNSEGDTVQQIHAYNKKWGQWVERGEKIY